MFEATENIAVQGVVRGNKRRRTVLIWSIVSLLNVGLLALLLTQLLTPASHASTDPLVGHIAPNFSLTILFPYNQSGTLSLANFKGKPIVLNFWASWCEPCNEEAPLLESSWRQAQMAGKNVIFLGIDYQDSNPNAISFLQRHGIAYANVQDASGAVALNYDVTALPQTIFINQQGRIVSRIRQELTAQMLASNLQLLN